MVAPSGDSAYSTRGGTSACTRRTTSPSRSIARNLLRQYHKHNRIETAARERLGIPAAWAECEEYEAVDERITAVSLTPLLRRAVGALPLEQRRALELRVVQQLDYDEVAGALGCSQNAARLRVSRALRALGLKLGGAQA